MKTVLFFRVAWLSFLIMVQTFEDVDAFEPITTTLAVGTAMIASGVITYFPVIKSRFFEVCDDNWVSPRLRDLRMALSKRLHGQHLVIDPVIKSLGAHLHNPNPAKALVMSFHGWTGNGKNFVSNIISDHLFKLGRNSSFVNLIIATHHFPHASRKEQYQDQLRNWVRSSVSRCERSLFIFDEVDKMTEGVLDAVKPFMDHHHKVDGLDFRKSIFIFLSNTGGNEIAEIAMNHWLSGGKREDLTLFQMETAIHDAAFNEDGGLRRSSVLDKSLVSIYVPFLPMEEIHIKLCIQDDLRAKGKVATPDLLKKVIKELRFVPEDTKLYSVTGCKRVTDKVDLIIDEDFDFFRK